jgi:membrane peptidoglycan carboxypeptidase
MLQQVTLDGTGKAASVIGYTTGGKTGTAQKVDPVTHRYSHQKYAAWFAGFVPADDPALVIVVMVDEPGGEHRHGGDVAAPVFSRVAEPVLRYLGVLPDRDNSLIVDPVVRVVSPRSAAAAPSAVNASSRRAGGGDASPVVQAGMFFGPSDPSLPAEPSRAAGGPGDSTMPDLTGLSLRQATEALARLGLNCTMQRIGSRVTRQEPVAGSSIRPGARCALILE